MTLFYTSFLGSSYCFTHKRTQFIFGKNIGMYSKMMNNETPLTQRNNSHYHCLFSFQRFKNIFQIKSKKTPNETASSHRDTQLVNNKEEIIQNQHFPDLIKRLNLESYYPKKMTKVNSLLINKTLLHQLMLVLNHPNQLIQF